MLIERSGLRMLEKIVRSCPPIVTNGGMDSKEYLQKLCSGEKDVNFDDFQNNFPEIVSRNGCYNVYEDIKKFADTERAEQIDERVVARFFAGNPHIQRASADVEDERLSDIISKAYAKKTFVSHVLLPIEITGIFGGYFSGKYCGVPEFSIRNLVSFPEEKSKIRIGSCVLTHYASIALADVEKGWQNEIVEMQSKNADFMEACNFVAKRDGIDHEKMLHFLWAEKAAKLSV